MITYFRKSLKGCRKAIRSSGALLSSKAQQSELDKQLDQSKGLSPARGQRHLKGQLVLDRLERQRYAKQFCMFSGMALLKGDVECAERMLWQANVYDPTSAYIEVRLNEVVEQAERLHNTTLASGEGRRKFDFLYTPTLRGLSTEFSSLAPLHPQVFSVPKTELDRAIESKGECALLGKYQRAILDDRPHIKGGLIQHAYIANQYAGPEVAARLAAITTRALFVHGVREPMEMAASTFNHQLIARDCGAYKFFPVVEETPFGRTAFKLEAWKEQARALGQGRATPIALDQAIIDRHLNNAVSRPRHFGVGHCYGQNFEVWEPIDLSRPSFPMRHTVQRLFEVVGVGTEMDHPAFYASEGTKVHRLMVQNFLDVNCFGYSLYLGLGFADRIAFSNTFPLCELFAFQADDKFDGTGLERQPLCVTALLDQWRLLPRDVRVRLIESDHLIEFCDLVLIPAWLESYASWTSSLERYLLRPSNPMLISRLKDQVGRDFELFIGRHPKFERLWPNAVKAFGG